MKRKAAWTSFCSNLAKDHSNPDELGNALQAIAYLSIPERKELLKISRTARHPYYNIHASSLKIAYPYYSNPKSDLQLIAQFGILVRTAVSILGNFIHKSPIYSAILNNACRSAPFLNISRSEGEQNRIDSWEKEIAACLEPPRGPVLDYDCWFSDDPEHRHKPLGPHLPSAPYHNTRIHRGFQEWRQSMVGARLFPQIQTAKSMSRATARQYWEKMDPIGTETRYPTDVTSANVERLYSDTGIELGSPCEIRQLWGYNDLTPRSYWSQGGHTFHASKYIRVPLNRLSDVFPEVNFVSRFSIQDILIHDEDIVFIYDYESFTSSLEEFQYFMAALADFCRGYEIQVVDSREGVIFYDLGDLIQEYNDVCNHHGKFMINRYKEDDFTVYNHTRAGFLGVYGNIVGSTVVHGLHATQIDGDYSVAKCIGDDAFVRRAYHLGMLGQSEIFQRLQVLGRVHPDKTTSWKRPETDIEEDTNSAWPYCKRPIFRSANRMIHEPNISLPILGRLCRFDDEIRTVEEETEFDLVKIAAIQTRSTFRQIRSLQEQYPVDTQALSILLSYLEYIYERLGMPVEGILPFESHKYRNEVYSGLFVPPLNYGVFQEDEWNLLERRYDHAPNVVYVPQVSMEERDPVRDLLTDHEAIGTATQVTSYLVKMGWVQSVQRKQLATFTFSEYKNYYEMIFNGDALFMYDFLVVDLYPSWIWELCVE